MYEALPVAAPLDQGDIVDDCPVFMLEAAKNIDDEPMRYSARVVVLTQACDLAQAKTSRVLVAIVHTAEDLVADDVLKPSFIRDHVRRGVVYGWYFLPAAPEPISLGESIVDLRNLHSVPRVFLESLIRDGKRVCQIQTPYREHLAQHLAVTYMRIGLPDSYETQE